MLRAGPEKAQPLPEVEGAVSDALTRLLAVSSMICRGRIWIRSSAAGMTNGVPQLVPPAADLFTNTVLVVAEIWVHVA